MQDKLSVAWKAISLVGVALMLGSTPPSSLQAQRRGADLWSSTKGKWKPKVYQFERYQEMAGKSPFGKLPVKSPPLKTAKQEDPPEKNHLTIAAISIIAGKPTVFLLNTKTKGYQKVDTLGENERKIRLLEISEEHYPQDVVAEVLINGRLTKIGYGKRKGGVVSAVNRNTHTITQNRAVKPVRNRAEENAETYTPMGAREDPDEMARLEKDALLAMEANIAREAKMTKAERMAMEKEMESDALAAMAEQADRDGYEVPWAKDYLPKQKSDSNQK